MKLMPSEVQSHKKRIAKVAKNKKLTAKERIVLIMIFHAKALSGKDVSEDTVLNTVLSAEDGYGMSNTQEIFHGNILRTMQEPGFKRMKQFPGIWPSFTIRQLAEKLFLVAFLLISLSLQSQVRLRVGAAKTPTQKKALTLGVEYQKSDQQLYKSDLFVSGKRSYFLLTPNISMLGGTEDALGSLSIQLTGLIVTYKDTVVYGVRTPNPYKTMQTFPISAGVEMGLFNAVNAILEAGWVPHYQSATKSFFRYTKFGFFLQEGYKVWSDTTDQSAEKVKTFIARLKGSFALNTPKLVYQGIGIGLVGESHGWYDLVHRKFYYRLRGGVRMFLTPDTSFDMDWMKGDGAPNFRQGEQFGVSLNVTF